MGKAATIGLSEKTKEKLRNLKIRGDSYEDLVNRLFNIIKSYDKAFEILIDTPDYKDALDEARTMFARSMSEEDWKLYDRILGVK